MGHIRRRDYANPNTIQHIDWLYFQGERNMNWLVMNIDLFEDVCQDLKLKNRDYTEVDNAIHNLREAVERLKNAASGKQLFCPGQADPRRTNPSI